MTWSLIAWAAMANPIQQGLKPFRATVIFPALLAAMANPIQQGLKHDKNKPPTDPIKAAMANPIQQGLKPRFDITTAQEPCSRNG